jgi:hypothetical protein
MWRERYGSPRGDREEALYIIAQDAATTIAAVAMSDQVSGTPRVGKTDAPVQPAPSEDDEKIAADFLAWMNTRASDEEQDFARSLDMDPFDEGSVPAEAYFAGHKAALRAQLADAPQLQNYFDEECRLRREAEIRADKAEAQLAERTKALDSAAYRLNEWAEYFDNIARASDPVLAHGLRRKAGICRGQAAQARAALDGKETH